MKFLLLLAIGVMPVLAQEESPVLKEFSKGNRQFSADVYRELRKNNSGNFLVCPLSVGTVLALVHAGAKGQTAHQLSSGLHLPETTEKIQEIFTQLASIFTGNEYYSLSSANKAYIKDGFKLSDPFKSTAVNVFGAEVQNIDFGKNEQAAAEMNRWVEDRTEKKIKNLIQSSDVSPNTVAILINAMFFQGKWRKEFYEDATKKELFHINSKNQVETDMMTTSDGFNYYESAELNAKFLELDYHGYYVTMTIVLPNDVEGLSALEARIADVLVSPDYKYNYKTVDVTIPKFKIETTIDFISILQSLGIKDAFEKNADFSGIGANQEKLSISKVVQKAFIEVDEKGTTAAAASVVEILLGSGSTSYEPHMKFIADHPFIFYLKHRSTILFVGRYVSGAN